MTMIIEVVAGTAKEHGNLYHNRRNQLRREIGTFSDTYIGERCGTARDYEGKHWDWWETEEAISGTNFRKIKVVPAT